MKKLLLSIAIIAASLSASAQTAGILVQPEFSTSNVKKGFFIQSDIIKGIGVYADYKFMNNEENFVETSTNQINAGLSVKVMPDLRVIAATSISNNERRIYYNTLPVFQNQTETRSVGTTYQFGAMYSASIFSVLGGFETGGSGDRITVGFGFNF